MLIFISYRRDDSAGHAGRLFDRLVARFGVAQVYRDVDSIDAGADFVEAVRQKVETCDVLLALIGQRWLSATDADGRWRLADEQDLVRVEIATAIGRNARVIPVLMQGAAMPRASDLPGALAALSRRNAVQIRDSHFDNDADELMRLLAPGWRQRWSRRLPRWPVIVGLAGVALAALLAWRAPGLRQQSPEEARRQLGAMSLPFEPEAFINSVRKGDGVAVGLFLMAGMPADSTGGLDNATAAEHAAFYGHCKVLETLVDHGAEIDGALRAASRRGDPCMVDAVLKHKLKPEVLDNGLISAAGNGRTDIARLLLDKGAHVDARSDDGHTPLAKAAAIASTETVRLLMDRGANVSLTFDGGKTALHETLYGGGNDDKQAIADIVGALLDKGASIEGRARYGNAEEPTPLLLAIQHEQVRAATVLLDRGADPKAQMTLDGSTAPVNALMLAALRGVDSLIPVLIAKGLDVNARNAERQSALTLAFGTSRNCAGTVRALLAAGALQSAGANDVTPLMLAAANSNGVDALRLLLAAGAPVDAHDSLGWTALMYAAVNRRADAIAPLLAAGADRLAVNREGRTALMLARASGDGRTTQALAP